MSKDATGRYEVTDLANRNDYPNQGTEAVFVVVDVRSPWLFGMVNEYVQDVMLGQRPISRQEYVPVLKMGIACAGQGVAHFTHILSHPTGWCGGEGCDLDHRDDDAREQLSVHERNLMLYQNMLELESIAGAEFDADELVAASNALCENDEQLRESDDE